MNADKNNQENKSNELYTLLPTVYSEHCPHCDSENISMIGDPEYNDEWECDDCKKTFGSFKTKVVNTNKNNQEIKSNELYPMLATVDLSWMWHCSDDPKNVLDYTELVADPKIAEALNKAAAMGFKGALQKMEELELIEMGDTDRSPKHSDQEKWNDSFN